MGIMSNNPVLAIAGAAVGLVSHAISSAISLSNAERGLQQKIATAKAQSVNIAGSDDVDLMVSYADNRLKVMRYEASDAVKNALFNLFYYFGYACEETGAPTHNNRYLFDYLQADARFVHGSNNVTYSPVFVDAVREKIAQGVTFIHTYMCVNGLLDTTYENWENSLL